MPVDTGNGYSSTFGFIANAMDQIKLVSTVESTARTLMVQDLEFYDSNQWAATAKSDRQAEGRPCLTINRLPQFIRQVTNQFRASRPAIQVTPLKGGATIKTAEAIQGIVRSIENNSDADVAYGMACEHQAIAGRGVWRIVTEWNEDEGSFEQDIAIQSVKNPLTVFIDPTGIKADKSDARFAFVYDDIPTDEFRKRFGEAALTSWEEYMTAGTSKPDWMPEGCVRTAEYFYREIKYVNVSLIEMPVDAGAITDADNRTDKFGRRTTTAIIESSKLPTKAKMAEIGWKVLGERKAERVQVKWARITPCQILEGNEDLTEGREWPGKYIPIIEVTGTESVVNGKVNIKGMVRDAVDSQKMLNFWASSIAEQLSLIPRAPYVAVEGQISGTAHESKWNNSNRKNYMFLEYKPVSVSGQIAPPPHRMQFQAEIQGMVEAFQLADNDLKSVMGFYDASLGRSGPEQSGKAILARQRQGEVGNSNYLDNMSRGLRYTGRILLDMIPRVYTPARVARIVGPDEKPKKVVIHSNAAEDASAIAESEGINEIYDVSLGKYDIAMGSGTSYLSRRMEAVDSMLRLVEVFPSSAPVMADLMVKNMDWPGAQEVAARLRALVPPAALSEEDGAPPAPTREQYQQLEQAMAELKKEIETDEVKSRTQIETNRERIQSNERIAYFQTQATLMSTMAKLDLDKAKLMIDSEISDLEARLSILREIKSNDTMGTPPPSAPPAAPEQAPAMNPALPPVIPNPAQ